MYNRNAAAGYAIKHAFIPNTTYKFMASYGDGGGDCTNFISQCLHAGGIPMSFSSPWPWWYKGNISINGSNDKWSISWTVANSLYWCLKNRYTKKLPGIKAVEVFDIGLLDIGDLIQYERNGVVYHSTIVTAFTIESGMKLPLITQHTYNALNISHIKPASQRMHFMKIIS